MAGRVFRLPYAQQGLEWSLQLIEHQMVATRTLQYGPLRRVLKHVLLDIKHHSEISTPFTMIEVIKPIKLVLCKPEGPLLK